MIRHEAERQSLLRLTAQELNKFEREAILFTLSASIERYNERLRVGPEKPSLRRFQWSWERTVFGKVGALRDGPSMVPRINSRRMSLHHTLHSRNQLYWMGDHA